jgi:hypothetical protein
MELLPPETPVLLRQVGQKDRGRFVDEYFNHQQNAQDGQPRMFENSKNRVVRVYAYNTPDDRVRFVNDVAGLKHVIDRWIYTVNGVSSYGFIVTTSNAPVQQYMNPIQIYDVVQHTATKTEGFIIDVGYSDTNDGFWYTVIYPATATTDAITHRVPVGQDIRILTTRPSPTTMAGIREHKANK